jgi:hypothetical protein
MVDLAELAARMGSIVTYDRRGSVLWFDGFEEGIGKWYKGMWGTGAAVTLTQQPALSGNYSCLLAPGTNDARAASIYRKFYRIPSGTVGLQFSFMPHQQLDYIRSDLEFFGGGYEYRFVLGFNNTKKSIYIINENRVDEDIATGINLWSLYGFWSTFKLVVDLDTMSYVRASCNATVYDLRGKKCRTEESTESDYTLVDIFASNIEGPGGISFVDDIILTTNE